MKTQLILTTLALALSTLISQPSTASAQGSLTPPAGAPAPVMKSLSQVEPRTPISSASYSIYTPGSYYLTTNLVANNSDGISIFASGVTVDLNGFTIKSTSFGAYAYSGIEISSAARNVTIKNGFIEGGITNNGSGTYVGLGFGYGIGGVTAPKNVQISGVSVMGCEYAGIRLDGNSVLVESCTVTSIEQYGILCSGAIIKSCNVSDCGTAIQCLKVSDSFGESTFNGLVAETVVNSTGKSISGIGIVATIATDSIGHRPSGRAIQATVANGCYATAGTNLITFKYNMP